MDVAAEPANAVDATVRVLGDPNDARSGGRFVDATAPKRLLD
jgi:hypothetical protein